MFGNGVADGLSDFRIDRHLAHVTEVANRDPI